VNGSVVVVVVVVVGAGVGLGVGAGVGLGVGAGVGLGVGEGVGLGVGASVGFGVGAGVGFGVGAGVGAAAGASVSFLGFSCTSCVVSSEAKPQPVVSHSSHEDWTSPLASATSEEWRNRGRLPNTDSSPDAAATGSTKQQKSHNHSRILTQHKPACCKQA